MENIIIIGILSAVLGATARYLYKAKKRGETCIGCPCSGQCGNQCGGCKGEEKDRI